MIVFHVLISPFLILLVLYTIWIQYEREGFWKYCKLLGIVAGPLDVFLNYTLVSLGFLEFPQKGEYTISKRLKRLQFNLDWRGVVARPIVFVLNYLAPSGKHI